MCKKKNSNYVDNPDFLGGWEGEGEREGEREGECPHYVYAVLVFLDQLNTNFIIFFTTASNVVMHKC